MQKMPRTENNNTAKESKILRRRQRRERKQKEAEFNSMAKHEQVEEQITNEMIKNQLNFSAPTANSSGNKNKYIEINPAASDIENQENETRESIAGSQSKTKGGKLKRGFVLEYDDLLNIDSSNTVNEVNNHREAGIVRQRIHKKMDLKSLHEPENGLFDASTETHSELSNGNGQSQHMAYLTSNKPSRVLNQMALKSSLSREYCDESSSEDEEMGVPQSVEKANQAATASRSSMPKKVLSPPAISLETYPAALQKVTRASESIGHVFSNLIDSGTDTRHLSTKFRSKGEVLDSTFKKGPYSIAESHQIDDSINSYMTEHNIPASDLYMLIKRRRKERDIHGEIIQNPYSAKDYDGFFRYIHDKSALNRGFDQIYDFVARKYNPVKLGKIAERKTYWSQEEDDSLLKFVELNGRNFVQFEKENDRSDAASRYRKLEGMVVGKWTLLEETTLRDAILKKMKEGGLTPGQYYEVNAWTEIAAIVGTRSGDQCRSKAYIDVNQGLNLLFTSLIFHQNGKDVILRGL